MLVATVKLAVALVLVLLLALPVGRTEPAPGPVTTAGHHPSLAAVGG